MARVTTKGCRQERFSGQRNRAMTRRRADEGTRVGESERRTTMDTSWRVFETMERDGETAKGRENESERKQETGVIENGYQLLDVESRRTRLYLY